MSGTGKAILMDFNTDTNNNKTYGSEPITSLDLAVYYNGTQKFISENNTWTDYAGDSTKNFSQASLNSNTLNADPDLKTPGNLIIIKAIIYCANNGTSNKVRVSDVTLRYKTKGE